jgi:hypothetical protein
MNIQRDKLISINKTKLILNDINIKTTKKTFIISMLGCARVGKSTFINGLISYIFNDNKYIAFTSSKSEHCTKGIDYIIFDYEDIKLIILDCQGLNYEDSKNDDKLLSFVYSISNIIIYHDVNIINNQTLNTLTSLCLVSNCIQENKKINKPILYFRMRDYNLDSDVNEILERTFENRNDQYDNVRKAIKKLFPNIKAFFTEPMGKREQHTINNKEYSLLYDDIDEYNFKFCFNEILSNINNNTNNINDLIIHMQKTVEQINNNEIITFENYDYYTLLINQRFKDFFDNIDKSIYDKIMITKYQKSINENEKQISKINNIIKIFKNKFKEIDNSLIEEQININFSNILNELNNNINKCHIKAKEFIQEEKHNIINKILSIDNLNIKIFKEKIIFYCNELFFKIEICKFDINNFINKYTNDFEKIYNYKKLIEEEHEKDIKEYENKIYYIINYYNNEEILNIIVNDVMINKNLTMFNNEKINKNYDNELFKNIEKSLDDEFYILEDFINLIYNNIKLLNFDFYKFKIIYNDNFDVKRVNIDNNILNELSTFINIIKTEDSNNIFDFDSKLLKSKCFDLKNDLILKNIIIKINKIFSKLNNLYIETFNNHLNNTYEILPIGKKLYEELMYYFRINNLKNNEILNIINKIIYKENKFNINCIITNKRMYIIIKKKLCDYISYNKKIFDNFTNGNSITIDYETIYGKHFIDKLIEKYIENEFLIK